MEFRSIYLLLAAFYNLQAQPVSKADQTTAKDYEKKTEVDPHLLTINNYYEIYSVHMRKYFTYSRNGNKERWQDDWKKRSSHWFFEPQSVPNVKYAIQHRSTRHRNSSVTKDPAEQKRLILMRLVLDRNTGIIAPKMANISEAAKFTIQSCGNYVRLYYQEDENYTGDQRFANSLVIVEQGRLKLYTSSSDNPLCDAERRPEADFLIPKYNERPPQPS